MPWETTEDYIRSGHKDPDNYSTARTIWISRSDGIKAIYGKRKDSGEWEIQSYLFMRSEGWTLGKAKEWFSSHTDQKHGDSGFLNANIEETSSTLVIPTIFTREGVQNKGLKTFDELEKAAGTLEGAPVVPGHPPGDRPVDPTVDRIIGECRGVEARASDRVIHGDTVIYKDKVTGEELKALRNLQQRSASVGYWSDDVPREGVFHGDRYERVATDIEFDHFAVLIERGACSVREGCGLGFDEDMFYTDYDKASEETKWSLDESEYTAEQLSYASSVVVIDGEIHGYGYTGDDLVKGGCYLPHHKPGDGGSHGGTLVWRGVAAAGAALMGSRGGVKIPGEAEGKAKNHLEKHYKEFDKTPPWKKDTRKDKEYGEKRRRFKVMSKEEKDWYLEKIEDLESAVKEYKERFDPLKEKLDETIEQRDEYKEKWDQVVEQREKKKQEKKEALIGEITESTGDDPETLEEFTVEQLELIKKRYIEKATDRKGQRGGEEGEGGGEYKGSIDVAGKELTVGSLLEEPGQK